MCQSSTISGRTLAGVALAFALLAGVAPAQQGGSLAAVVPDWRRIGGATVDLSLASLAGGPVDRVWYSADGGELFVLTRSGRMLRTADYEQWEPVAGSEPAQPPSIQELAPAGLVEAVPEAGARVRMGRMAGYAVYAFGQAVYRTEDGGRSWRNLTDYLGQSLIGPGLADMAVSPRDPAEIVVAGQCGVWRSLDGGLSWTGLNEGLPNLPVRRVLRLAREGQRTRVLPEGLGVAEWATGEKQAWRLARDEALLAEELLRRELSARFGETISGVALVGDYYIYAGSAGGRLWASSDAGDSWRSFETDGSGAIQSIWVDPSRPAVALAAAGGGSGGGRVLRTTNAGLFWDDLTANLASARVNGIAADTTTGSVYAATEEGLFHTVADLAGGGPARDWARLGGRLAEASIRDVRLDPPGNQICVAVDGWGVFAAIAPHRFLAPSVVNAADLLSRAASPGALLSVLGGDVRTASAAGLDVPVLAATGGESQIQIPFNVRGDALSLAFTARLSDGAERRFLVGLPLWETAPAIFVDRDGSPMLLDAASGVLLDAMNAARPGMRVQILATGLGKVEPDWPTGMPAPLEDPPRVVAPVQVFLDRMPLEVTRATLAPGYVGFYIVEVEIPAIVNYGPAELYLKAESQISNRTRVYLEP